MKQVTLDKPLANSAIVNSRYISCNSVKGPVANPLSKSSKAKKAHKSKGGAKSISRYSRLFFAPHYYEHENCLLLRYFIFITCHLPSKKHPDIFFLQNKAAVPIFFPIIFYKSSLKLASFSNLLYPYEGCFQQNIQI